MPVSQWRGILQISGSTHSMVERAFSGVVKGSSTKLKVMGRRRPGPEEGSPSAELVKGPVYKNVRNKEKLLFIC
jgi:hypothetical protein